MMGQNENDGRARCRVDSTGRMLIPAEIRQQLHIAPGDELIVEVRDGRLTARSFQDVLCEVRGELQQHATPGGSVVDELLAERRAEAARE